MCVCVCVRAGRQTQGKVPLTNRDPDKEAARVRSRWRCGGSESQRFPLRLPPSHAHSRLTMNASLCRVTWLLVYFYSGGEKSLSMVSFHRGRGQQRQRSACSLGEWQSSGSWCTHHDWEQNQTPACWMCQVSQLCLMSSAILTQIFLGDADEALGHFVFPGYAATEKTFTFITRQTTPEFTTKRSSRVLKFQHR